MARPRRQDLGQDRAYGPLLVVVGGPAAFADQMLPRREVAPRPDPVGRTLDDRAFGEPTVPGDALDGEPKGLALPQRSRWTPKLR